MERAKTAVSRALRPILAAFVVVSLNAASPEVRGAPTGDELALVLRDNVVSIIAEWQNGETHDGFGFIAGERDGQLYIATANHLVRGALPDEFATTMDIEFHSRQGQIFPGKLLATSDKPRDLAVLRVPLPQGLTWRKDVVSDIGAQRLMSVWFVGRAGRWYVPSTPGTVNEIGLDDRIAIDDLNVRVGTSGAPLIAESGIVGMVVSEESGITYAVSIEFIKRAFGHWNHPWQLTALETIAPLQKLSFEQCVEELQKFISAKKLPPSWTDYGIALGHCRNGDLESAVNVITVPTLSYAKELEDLRKPEVAIDLIEAKYVTIRNANVREEPTVKSAKVTTLKRGTEVHVAGKVKDKNWYLVERDDRTLGYVFGNLLRDVETAEARREEAERNRAEAEARQQEERRKAAELARQQEEERKRAEAEARQQEERRKAAEEARRQEEERKRAEAEARRQDEERIRAERVRPPGVRIFNVLPVVYRGRRLDQLTAVINRALAAVPASKVISKPDEIVPVDTVVSLLITRLNQRMVPNPKYQGAQIARSIFGNLGKMITQNVPSHLAAYTAHVAVTAKNRKTGEVVTEDGLIELTEDARQAKARMADEALRQATEEAVGRLVIRLTGGVPPPRSRLNKP